MSTIALIAEKLTMTLPDAPERDAWFLDYVLRSPKQAGKHLTAGWLALESISYLISDVESCVEYFGGMGAQAGMVEWFFDLKRHRVHEYNLDAIAHLEDLRDAGGAWAEIEVAHRDAYAPSSFVAADLVMLDFGDLTAWKTREGQPHRELLDRVFAGQPKAVVFTDIACRYLHLHRERYESLLGAGTCDTYGHYLVALLERFEELWGYTLVRGYVDRWSSVMALVPGGQGLSGPIRDGLFTTPDSPVGLELL